LTFRNSRGKLKDMNVLKPTIAVVYTDQGPGGPCGQDMITTSCWTKVYLFYTEDDARKWIETFQFPKRKKSQVTMCFLDESLGGYISTLEYPNHKLSKI